MVDGNETTAKRGRGVWSPFFLATALAIVVSDLATKAWAWDFVGRNGVELWGVETYKVTEWLRVVKAENPGTIWGLFQGSTLPLIFVRIVMVAGLVFLAVRSCRRERFKLVGLGLVLGGAIGNLHDNLLRDSRSVRDWIDCWIPLPWREDLWHYPTFNIADSAILCGAILLFFAFGREPRTARKRAVSEVGEQV